jgi:hypothetical protein
MSRAGLGSARVSRAGEAVSGSRTFREAHFSRVEAMLERKIVSARRRNQHARPVRYPDYPGGLETAAPCSCCCNAGSLNRSCKS